MDSLLHDIFSDEHKAAFTSSWRGDKVKFGYNITQEEVDRRKEEEIDPSRRKFLQLTSPSVRWISANPWAHDIVRLEERRVYAEGERWEKEGERLKEEKEKLNEKWMNL
jgi:hypothetical protein